jgi:hypothetical protein
VPGPLYLRPQTLGRGLIAQSRAVPQAEPNRPVDVPFSTSCSGLALQATCRICPGRVRPSRPLQRCTHLGWARGLPVALLWTKRQEIVFRKGGSAISKMFRAINHSQTSGLQRSPERTKVVANSGRGHDGTHLFLTEGILAEAARKVLQGLDNVATRVFSTPQSLPSPFVSQSPSILSSTMIAAGSSRCAISAGRVAFGGRVPATCFYASIPFSRTLKCSGLAMG